MADWTQADADALKAALKTGILSVRYEGPPARQITYQSLSEMRALLAEMEGSAKSAPSHRFASTRKGF